MGDENLIRTLGDYSKPSHEGYRNTIELHVRNNVVPLRSDTIRGKLRDHNTKESWALLEDLALYDNVSWNDPRDFAKSVKVIALPQDVPSTSNRRLVEIETQVQCLMEAHLAPTQPTQVDKITTSCEICNGPHDTQYCMKNPKQAFVDYASSRTNEALVSAKQDDQQITIMLKAITDRIAGTLPSDTVKNQKLGATPVLSNCSYPTSDPQCSSHPSNLINAIKARFKEATISQTSLQQPEIETEPPQLKSLNQLLKINFKICILTYWSVFGVKGVDLGEEEAPYWTTLEKRESYKLRHGSDGVGAQTSYYVRKDFLDCHFPGEWEISRDTELNPFKDTLVFRRMVEFLGAIPSNLKCNIWESEDLIKKLINWDKPSKNRDGAWHAKIKLIDPDGEEFTKTLQSIPTTRKLSQKESLREIIDLNHFYDT
nr:MAK10-like protein [Tanacetum cinerariifolium]